MTHAKLVRNNQEIGLIPPEVSVGSARADGCAYLKIKLVQCEVSFNPVSSHDNLQDKIMNVQENKNQHDGESLPVNFTRLIAEIKDKKAVEIWRSLEAMANAKYQEDHPPSPPPRPPTPPPDDSESDVDSESEESGGDEPSPRPPRPEPTPPPPVPPIVTGVIGSDICEELRDAMTHIDGNRMYPDNSLIVKIFHLLMDFNDSH
jgi:hypothetical protein